MCYKKSIVKIKYSSDHRHTDEFSFPSWNERRENKRQHKFKKSSYREACDEIKREVCQSRDICVSSMKF